MLAHVPAGFRFGLDWVMVEPDSDRDATMEALDGNGRHELRKFFGQGQGPYTVMVPVAEAPMTEGASRIKLVMERHMTLLEKSQTDQHTVKVELTPVKEEARQQVLTRARDVVRAKRHMFSVLMRVDATHGFMGEAPAIDAAIAAAETPKDPSPGAPATPVSSPATATLGDISA